ncbi:IS30 family transposase [Aeromonas salmonicida subsp. salmonicida]|nr:IS30 family transposase [Aeromonas salmonicida subsp. salmonicida]
MAKRPKACLLERNSRLRELVLEKLELKWSPEQISGGFKRTMPRQKAMQISAETIYKTLYFRSRSALHHLLVKHLRRSHSLRHGKRHTRKGERGTINIVNGISIHERSRHIESLTWDRGMELAKHLEFTANAGVKVYFCDPQSPWQRGTNENTNGLIRQYFPKKTCLAQYSQQELDTVAAQLNSRPRKILKFKTPKEVIEKSVALTS